VISDKSQGSVAARLRYGELFSYHLPMYLSLSAVVKHFKIGECLESYRQKSRLPCVPCLPCNDPVLKDEELAR